MYKHCSIQKHGVYLAVPYSRHNKACFFKRYHIHNCGKRLFYNEDYERYQPDFEEKLITVFTALHDRGYKSCFFEELIENNVV